MSRFEMKLPDVGEGVAEAEIVSWMVAVGDEVTAESVLAEVLTDKATVEVSSPVSGTVAELHGEPGDLLAVGSNLIGIEVADDAALPEPDPAGDAGSDDGDAGSDDDDAGSTEPPESDDEQSSSESPPSQSTTAPTAPAAIGDDVVDPRPAGAGDAASTRVRVTAAPAVRRRAADLGIDLGTVEGTGPDGRIVHADLDRLLVGGEQPRAPRAVAAGAERVEPVRGLRRRIAQRLTTAWTEIPHITYVDAVDVTQLETLRTELNRADDAARLTLLPFLVRAIAIACGEQPGINAHYDHSAETLTVHDAVHVGIATQTDDGLMVPVVRDAGARRLRDLAAEITRVADAARDGSAPRDLLGGSTITVTSLGALGGLVTTPILNPPEVAIVGVNKIEVRPVWQDGAFQPRKMLNLSSSFDHRMIDGWDAAVFVQRIKALLEIPALLFTGND